MKIEYQKWDGRNRLVIVHLSADHGFTFAFSVPSFHVWRHPPHNEYRLVGPLGYYYESFREDYWALDWQKSMDKTRLLQRNFSGVWHNWCYLTATWVSPVSLHVTPRTCNALRP